MVEWLLNGFEVVTHLPIDILHSMHHDMLNVVEPLMATVIAILPSYLSWDLLADWWIFHKLFSYSTYYVIREWHASWVLHGVTTPYSSQDFPPAPGTYFATNILQWSFEPEAFWRAPDMATVFDVSKSIALVGWKDDASLHLTEWFEAILIILGCQTNMKVLISFGFQANSQR